MNNLPFYLFGWFSGKTPNSEMLEIDTREPNNDEKESGYYKIKHVLRDKQALVEAIEEKIHHFEFHAINANFEFVKHKYVGKTEALRETLQLIEKLLP